MKTKKCVIMNCQNDINTENYMPITENYMPIIKCLFDNRMFYFLRFYIFPRMSIIIFVLECPRLSYYICPIALRI